MFYSQTFLFLEYFKNKNHSSKKSKIKRNSKNKNLYEIEKFLFLDFF